MGARGMRVAARRESGGYQPETAWPCSDYGNVARSGTRTVHPHLTRETVEFLNLGLFGATIGAGLAVLGAAIGIGMIGSRAAEATARQPEMSGDIRTTSIILAALIEGAAIIALVISIIVGFGVLGAI